MYPTPTHKLRCHIKDCYQDEVIKALVSPSVPLFRSLPREKEFKTLQIEGILAEDVLRCDVNQYLVIISQVLSLRGI